MKLFFVNLSVILLTIVEKLDDYLRKIKKEDASVSQISQQDPSDFIAAIVLSVRGKIHDVKRMSDRARIEFVYAILYVMLVRKSTAHGTPQLLSNEDVDVATTMVDEYYLAAYPDVFMDPKLKHFEAFLQSISYQGHLESNSSWCWQSPIQLLDVWQEMDHSLH